MTSLGRFTAPAANEPGRLVDAEVFAVNISRSVEPAAEIGELLWIDPDRTGAVELAPLTRDKILHLCAIGPTTGASEPCICHAPP